MGKLKKNFIERRFGRTGPYNYSRAPFQKEILDEITDQNNNEIVFVAARQVGKNFNSYELNGLFYRSGSITYHVYARNN